MVVVVLLLHVPAALELLLLLLMLLHPWVPRASAPADRGSLGADMVPLRKPC